MTIPPRAAVLVEGTSDQAALEALARRLGRELDAEGIAIVAMGGATNVRKHLDALGPKGLDVRLAGLCDVGEAGDFACGLEAELKRMWVASTARGLGLGRRLLDALEQRARELGSRTLRLETNRTLTEAIAMYRSAGYQEVEAFNDEAYAHHWFEKHLDAEVQD